MERNRGTETGAPRGRRGGRTAQPREERAPVRSPRPVRADVGTGGAAAEDRPCIWMTAGLLRYKLCDRDFDCDRCPLDAALRGAAVAAPAAGPDADAAALPGPTITFPDELRYGPGHTWLEGRRAGAGEPRGGRLRCRVGLDAFVAALLGVPRKVRPVPGGCTLGPGEPLCELVMEAGTLPVAAPVGGCVVEANPVLVEDPSRLVTSPYGEGWLVDMDVPSGLPEGGLVVAADARRRAGHDLRRLRRRIALRILADGGGSDLGPTLPDGGELVTDLRSLLGPRRYLELLRELVR